MPHAGNVSCEQTWEILSTHGKSQLIDVRTQAEWVYVGVPVIASLGRDPIFVEWQTFPGMNIAPDFVGDVERHLKDREIPSDAPLLFLCRSGVRSRSAAQAMADAGYVRAFNVEGGFEGGCDEMGHRGNLGGWKHAGLPWTQR